VSSLLHLASTPWAITPEAFETVQAVLARHLAGERADLAAIEAQLGRPLSNPKQATEMIGSVAVIPLTGVLAKRANLLSDVSGASSTAIAVSEVTKAANDPAVKAILLSVDSPGGTVDGTQALADAVRSVRGVKPIVAAIDGTGASAAYWIASAADRVYIAGETVAVGSIGVIATHRDVSGAEAQRGVRTTQVTSGPLKAVPSPYGALDSTGREVLQAQVDHLHRAFASDVKRNRGLGADALTRVADGRLLHGSEAIRAGLADGIRTAAQLVADLQGGAIPHASARPAATAAVRTGDLVLAAARYRAEQAAAGHNATNADVTEYLSRITSRI
jgi:signal peptide peptidase SppA